MVNEKSRQKIGAILFEMVALAMAERDVKMLYPGWDAITDAEVKSAYLRFADRIITVCEEEKVSDVPSDEEIITAEKNLSSQEVLSTASVPEDELPDEVKILLETDEQRKKRVMNDRMARARAARGKTKSAVAST